MAELFQRVNSCKFDIKVAPRRQGDIGSSVLKTPSVYMKQLYALGDLLIVNNKDK